MKTRIGSILFAAILALPGCGGSSSSGGGGGGSTGIDTISRNERSFYMGFTPWLYEATLSAQDLTYARLEAHGDIIKHHLLGGIPWQEALDGTPYHPNVESEIQGRLARTPVTSEVFLAIDALDQNRAALAPYRGATDNIPLSGAWASRTWSSPEVIAAYIAYAEDMITRFDPLYFEYGTEASELLVNDAVAFADYLIFAEAVYNSLKTTFPNLNIMVSIALKTPGNSDMQLIEASIGPLLAYSDIVGISVYPYAFFSHFDKGDPARLPTDWLTQVKNFSGSKPLAISETGWIGEDLDIATFSYSESSDEAKQDAYLQELLTAANQMQMAFVIWWTVADFDTLWTSTLGQDPLAKIWKDIGLYDESQVARQALTTWDTWYARNRVN